MNANSFGGRRSSVWLIQAWVNCSTSDADVNLFSDTFFPDGSSDSTEITLAPRNAEDGRRLIVKLTGMTGAIRRKIQAAEETLTEPETPEPASKPSPQPMAVEPK